MPVMQPPTGPIEVSDPNNVQETFVNGPFNIVKGGGLVHLTFTAARPNPSDLFKGEQYAWVSSNSNLTPIGANGNGRAVVSHSRRRLWQGRPANRHEAADHQTDRSARKRDKPRPRRPEGPAARRGERR